MILLHQLFKSNIINDGKLNNRQSYENNHKIIHTTKPHEEGLVLDKCKSNSAPKSLLPLIRHYRVYPRTPLRSLYLGILTRLPLTLLRLGAMQAPYR